jgi:putative cardiolipin synthase
MSIAMAQKNPISGKRGRMGGRAAALSMALIMLLGLTGCAGPSLKKELVRDPPSFAPEATMKGPLWELATEMQAACGAECSGFRLLDGSREALEWRLALIDSAVSSVDIQTYLWYPDHSGRLILDRAIRAADRGVQVRLVIDDLLTIGLDQVIYELHRHPNIQVRLFNPWKDRSMVARGGQMIAEMERLNTRMHDKLMIADGRAAIVGGRNLGDHYFGLSDAYNFHDLDLLGFGHIAEQANGMFDHFWNSEWVVSADNLDTEADPEFARRTLEEMRANIDEAPELEAFPQRPVDWSAELQAVRSELHPGTSTLVYDATTRDAVEQNVAKSMFPFMGLAQEELLITNAYIIPGQPSIDFVSELTERGVTVRILTNSLASHDVPAVNSHYKGWRDDFIRAGAELHELRADARIQSLVDVPPVAGGFVGLHTKSFVVDRRLSFIGSMNFDPRSVNINTEAGAFVESEGLGQDLAALMLRDMLPENAWRVLLDEKGRVYWVNDEETVTRQPARSGSQRVMDQIFRIFPKEQY